MRSRRLLMGLGGLLGSILLAAIAGSVWLYHDFTSPGPAVSPVRLILPKGIRSEQIALRLVEAGALRDRWAFLAGRKFAADHRPLKAGEYELPAAASPADILAQMQAGRTVIRRLTIPEGLTSALVVALLDSAPGFDGKVPSEPPPEGCLFPDTYFYSWGDSRLDMLARMRHAMTAIATAAWSHRALGLPLKTPREAVILASIIEKESAAADERPQVAAVFLNRLRLGMRLQADPTVTYGESGANGDGPPIRAAHEPSRAELDAAQPYNTYLNIGLPPGPIDNPGRQTIEAALHPAETDALYFVADGTGRHVFARTLAEHNRNVARWRRSRTEAQKRG